MFPLSSKFKLNDPLDSSLAIWNTTSFSRYVDELKLKSRFIAIEIPREQFHQMHQPTHRHESVFEIHRVAQCTYVNEKATMIMLFMINHCWSIDAQCYRCDGQPNDWRTDSAGGVSSYSGYWSRPIIKVNWIHHLFREHSDVTYTGSPLTLKKSLLSASGLGNLNRRYTNSLRFSYYGKEDQAVPLRERCETRYCVVCVCVFELRVGQFCLDKALNWT